jgi:hypothetical protein
VGGNSDGPLRAAEGAELGVKAAFMVEYLSMKDAGLRRTLGAKGAIPPLVKWLESSGHQVGCSLLASPRPAPERLKIPPAGTTTFPRDCVEEG